MENMEPPDRQGQHVRHCKTHRNAFVQELGPKKMLVFCPDKNVIEPDQPQQPPALAGTRSRRAARDEDQIALELAEALSRRGARTL